MDRSRLGDAMEATRRGHVGLSRSIAGLTDETAQEPSLLPDWSRGHLVTHIARNADSHVRMITAAMEGRQVEQYEGGYEGRASAIEAGATRPVAELIDDFETSAARLFELWPAVPEEAWDEGVVAVHGGQPAWITVFSRLREIEIHHVDLGLGYGVSDWPPEFVELTFSGFAKNIERRLPEGMQLQVVATDFDLSFSAGRGDLETVRGPGRELVAWLAGRAFSEGALRADSGTLPPLGPWL